MFISPNSAVTTSNPDILQHFSYDAFVRVLEEFESRFKDIMEYKEFFNIIENPFHVPVSSLTPVITALCPDHAGIESEIVSSLTPVITALCPDRAGIESEIVELQANDTLQGELRSGVTHF